MRVMETCRGQGLPPGEDPLESKDFSRQNGAGKGKEGKERGKDSGLCFEKVFRAV